MFDCFKKKNVEVQIHEPEKPAPAPIPVPIKEDTSTPMAFIVGHNQKAQGAVNYLGESEWVFNQRVAKKASMRLAEKGVRSAVVFRPAGFGYNAQVAGVKKQVGVLGSLFAFELHFNGSENPAAGGCEVLVRKTDSKMDDMVGDFITDQLNEKFAIKERGNDGLQVVAEGHNGYGMLHALWEVGCLAVIVEPCFALNRKEGKHIFENEEAYVDVLVEAAYKLCKGELSK